MTITTICMAGAGPVPKLAANHLGGELFAGQYRRKDLLYLNQNPDIAAYVIAKAQLKATLMASKGQVVFVGHSFGARIGAGLLREDGDDPAFLAAVSPDRVAFVFTGNPERKYNGACNISGSLIVAAYGGNGVPEETPYRVWDVARQYEFFADHPNQRTNKDAIKNAAQGFALHLDYSKVRMGDPTNQRIDEGNISYILAPTYPLPAIEKKRWLSFQAKDREDAIERPKIEKAFTRPFPPSTTRLNRIGDGDYAWDATQQRVIKAPRTVAWSPFA